MKKYLIILFILPFTVHGQLYNHSSSDSFKYKEIGDTVFINDTYLTPGDTLFLGKGSAPDRSFIHIYESKTGGFFCFRLRYLPNLMSEQYLIYKERKKNKGFFYNGFADYLVLFTCPGKEEKSYVVDWYAAIETHEIRLSRKLRM